MAIGFQVCSDMIDDRRAMQMPAKEFVRQFRAAADGEQVYLSKFVKPWNGRQGNSEWAAIRARIFKRDDYTCTYCGERGKKLECDHIHPVSKGGKDDDANLTTACFKCNRSKRDKTLEEWKRA